MPIIRIEIRGNYDSRLINDISRRHRQRPRMVAVESFEIGAKALIYLDQIIGKREFQAESFGNLVANVAQNIKFQIIFAFDLF